MMQFELDYAKLITDVLTNGVYKQGRNGGTYSVFGRQLTIDFTQPDELHLLQGRKMFPKGVLGEFAAFINKPKTVQDFEKFGCNYWKSWADGEGNLNVDYGNAWFEDGQLEHLFWCLEHDQSNRRMLINSWVPGNLKDLSLPCCHYCYQFYVANGKLHMVWIQRSVDVMIGLPSDILLADLWIHTLCKQFNLQPGSITMQLGDTHIYESHLDSGNVHEYLNSVHQPDFGVPVKCAYLGEGLLDFKPELLIHNYNDFETTTIPFELIS